MRLRVASYNIRKAIGIDRRRDPERIMAVLREIDADIVTLQEADRRFGRRVSAIPRLLILHAGYHAAPMNQRPDSIGWHGNALLLRTGIEAIATCPVDLPTLEPRGAISADLAIGASRLRIIGMHLDLSGLRRRHQAMAIAAHCASRADDMPTVLMGDLNEWSTSGGVIGEFGRSFSVLSPGRSFHARRPVAQLDRIMHSDGIDVLDCGVHHSALAARASDHLPVWADIRLSARPAR